MSVNPLVVTGNRMSAGEPVGEGWLYGRQAVELIAGGYVTAETMRRYRSGAFLARRGIYGEADAKAWEQDALARHEAAKDMWRGRKVPK